MSEIVEKKGVTLRSIVIGLVLLLFLTVWSATEGMFHDGWGASYDPIEDYGTPGWGSFTPFFIVALLTALFPKALKLSPQELTIVWMMGVFGGIGAHWAFVSGPEITVWLQAPEGGGSTYQLYHPWLYKAPYVYISWSVFITLWVLSACFLNLMFRRRLLELERLNFPIATVPLYTIASISEEVEGKAKIFKDKIFWIGFVVGVLYGLPGFFQWFLSPAVFTVPPEYSMFDATELTKFSVPMAIWTLSYPLHHIAFWFFWPMDVLFSVWFINLIGWKIAPPIAVTLGMLKDVSAGGKWPIHSHIYYGDGVTWNLFTNDPQNWRSFWVDGGLIGFSLISVIFGWRAVADFIRRAISRSSERSQEPIPERIVLIGFILCFLAFWGFTVSLGADAVPMLIWLIVLMLYSLGITRAIGEAYLPCMNAWYHDFNNPWVNRTFYQGATLNQGLLTTITFVNSTGGLTSMGVAGGAPYVMTALHVAKSTNTKERDVIIVGIISVIISMIVAMSVYYYLMSIFGWKGRHWEGPGRVKASVDQPGLEPSWCRPDPVRIFLGAVVVLVLYFLRLKFAWWPINPLGFILAGNPRVNVDGAFLVALIAWALKFSIFKIGGSRLYYKVLPFFVGIIVGWTIPFWMTRIYVFPQYYGTPGSFPVP
ncbi:MAG: DUF6785 family protein [Candidatus Bathyarchaeia archaeon]